MWNFRGGGWVKKGNLLTKSNNMGIVGGHGECGGRAALDLEKQPLSRSAVAGFRRNATGLAGDKQLIFIRPGEDRGWQEIFLGTKYAE